jgi:branched-chain amino acid transport system permease protein
MYASIASGLTLIWGTMKMRTFPWRVLYDRGYFVFFALNLLGISGVWCIVISVAIVLVLGMLFEKGIIEPLLGKPGWELSPLVATVGASIAIQNGALKLWGEHIKNLPYYIDGTVEIMGCGWLQRLMILFVTAFVMIGFWVYTRSRI